MRASFLPLIRTLSVFAASCVPLLATDITQVVSFGDSLSDAGNAAIATGGQYPGANYATAQWTGAPPWPVLYTDGANTSPGTTMPHGLWVDQLAVKLQVPDPVPAIIGGTNFAVASAETESANLADLGNQVLRYGSALLPSAGSGARLFTVWAGANDILSGGSGSTAADNIALDIRQLAVTGATQFLWLDLPALGDTPLGSQNAGALNAQSAAFNAEWQVDLYQLEAQGISVVGVDVNSLFNRILADQASGCNVSAADPYCFANVTAPAQGQNVNPDMYLFWDQEHPTTAADALIGDLAYADLAAVPEPSTVFYLIAGLGLLLGSTLRRHSRLN